MTDEMAYVAKAPCGEIVAATMDSPRYRNQIASDVATWIRDGLIVLRMTSEEVRTQFGDCKHPGRGTCFKCPKAEGQRVLEESNVEVGE